MRKASIAVLAGLLVALFAAAWWRWGRGSDAGPSLPGAGDWQIVKAFPNLEFDRPLWMSQLPGGDWLMVEQGGLVYRFPPLAGTRDKEVFVDLRDRVSRASNEEGLLGLALHPEYDENGRFIVYYSASSPRRSVLSELRAVGGAVDPASERVLLEVEQPYQNHNGGCVLFGPDGMLYVALGDGGAANDPHDNGQNLRTLLGAILRIDVDRSDGERPYAIPPDNPLADDPARGRPELFAWGLRNPWRMSFDRATGELWAADVGQDKWEEVDRIERGGNYGWRWLEATHPHKGTPPRQLVLTAPVFEYGRGRGGSITGGYVYRGARHTVLQGLYLFGDFASTHIWALRLDGGSVVASGALVRGACAISSFAESRAGELYVLCFDGYVYELTPRREEPE